MRGRLVVLLMLLGSVAIAPGAVAEWSVSDSVSTGEVDAYSPSVLNCLQVVTTWTITLTLENPSPTDVVSLTAEGTVGGGADVATGQSPTASVSWTQTNGCIPAVQVGGLLVDGSVDYTLTYDPGP